MIEEDIVFKIVKELGCYYNFKLNHQKWNGLLSGVANMRKMIWNIFDHVCDCV